MHITDILAKRFWGKTKRVNNGCLEWIGRTGDKGYGLFRVGSGRQKTRVEYRAHRIAYCIKKKCDTEDIADQLICHHCDNPRCVEPKHLYRGTHRKNMQDAISRDRFKPKYRPYKLSQKDVRMGRRLRKAGHSAEAVAQLYDVNPSSIKLIDKGKSYAWVD